MIKLWDWQKEALKTLQEHDYNGVVKVASGKGKTVLAIAIIEKIIQENKNEKILVVVPTIALLQQWTNELKKFLPEISVSHYYGAKKDENGKVIISVINTATKKPFTSTFRLKILDEIHHYGADLFQEVFGIKTLHTIGLSATPEREDEGDYAIRYGAGKIVYSLHNLAELKKRFSICTIRIPFSPDEYKEYTSLYKDYKQLLLYANIKPHQIDYYAKQGNKYALKILKIWSEMARLRNHAKNKYPVIKQLVQLEEKEKIIIFTESIKFTETIGKQIGAIIVHSGLSKKVVLKRLEEFRTLNKGILIAPRMLDEGYDVPDASVAIIASFTRSPRQMIQRDGRLLRQKGQVRRYTLVIEEIEEGKYFTILQKTNLLELAQEGEWLCYNRGFIQDNQGKKLSEEFLENNNEYELWVAKQLEYYARTKQYDSGFYERHKRIIEELVQEHPGRWQLFEKKTPPTNQKKEFKNPFCTLDARAQAKEDLRKVNAKLSLPDELFRALMRFIEGEPFELDKDTKDDILSLAEHAKSPLWPEKVITSIKILAIKLKEENKQQEKNI